MKSVISEYATTVLALVGTTLFLSIVGKLLNPGGLLASLIEYVLESI